MNKAYFIGIDVSKMTLDIAIHKHAEPQVQLKVSVVERSFAWLNKCRG